MAGPNMQSSILIVVAFLTWQNSVICETISFGTGDNEFAIEFVEIGNPGNPDDDVLLDFGIHRGDRQERAGAVDYTYAIAKFEVSRKMIETANAQAGLGIHMFDYSPLGVENREEMPAAGLNQRRAAQFVNWLNTSLGYHEAYKFNLQGSWEEGEPGFSPNNTRRNHLAKFFLPTADEWHKAAYYDPSKDDGEGGYWDYPTGSDEPPLPVLWGTHAETAVYDNSEFDGPADIMEAGGLSPYGVMAMGGNVGEWDERLGYRGGDWFSPELLLQSSMRLQFDGFGTLAGIRLVMAAAIVSGDLDSDGAVTSGDIDLLSEVIREMDFSPSYDFNTDGVLDHADRAFWVEEIVGTHFGDANLDEHVNFADFTALADKFNQPAGWAGGDFDGNGITQFSDFLILAENFGAASEAEAAASVPEPSTSLLFLVGVLACLGIRKQHR